MAWGREWLVNPRKTQPLHKKCPYSEFFWSVFFRLRTEYGEIRNIQSKCGKIRTRKTTNTDTFYAVNLFHFIVQVLEAVTPRYSVKKIFFKILQKSQENTFVGVSFFFRKITFSCRRIFLPL